MIEIVSFSRKSWKIAQNSQEEQPPDSLDSQLPTLANSTDNYLGLVFLSGFLFLFLIFLLLKRKTKEIRLSIFATFLLASLLTVYTSVQITTKFLIGDENDSKTERISAKDEIIIGQTKKNKVRDQKPKDKRNDNKENLKEEKIESKLNNSDESENKNVQEKKLGNENNKKTESNREEGNISQEANTTNSVNNVPNTSRSSISQSSNLEQSLKPENSTTSNQNKRNSDNSTIRQRNLSSASQQTPINRGNNSRDRSNNAINRGNNSRDRSNSASVQTSLFRPILLKLGDRGSDVILVQTLLKELGYYTFNIDGDYGLSTELAVRNFQQQNNLLVDGVIGFSTCNILNAKTTNTDIKCSNR